MGTYPPRGALALYDPQPISDRPVGLGFPHRAGRFRPGGSPLSSPGCRSCKGIERFLIREWNSPGCAGFMHDPKPVSDRPVRLGFLHRAGRYRPEESAFMSPGCWSCRGMEGCLTRGYELIIPGVRWLYVRSPANQRSAGGAGDHRFRPRVVGVGDVWRDC